MLKPIFLTSLILASAASKPVSLNSSQSLQAGVKVQGTLGTDE